MTYLIPKTTPTKESSIHDMNLITKVDSYKIRDYNVDLNIKRLLTWEI